MKIHIDKAIMDLSLHEFAVGNDLVYLPDFVSSCTDLFKTKVFTSHEIEYCNSFDQPMLRYASTWAAKEAVYKAVKQLYKQALPFKKIEVLRSKIAGIPKINLPANLSELDISLSITHDGDYAFAIAIVKKTYD